MIKERSVLEVSDEFDVLMDTIFHTEGAFDSDYRLELLVKFDEIESKKIRRQIEKLANYWQSENLNLDSTEMKEAKAIFKKVGTRGLWYKTREGFDFTNSIMESIDAYEAEPTWISFDTLKNELHYSLSHL
jgi:hypothetical protein